MAYFAFNFEAKRWQINLVTATVGHSNHFQSALCILQECNICMQKLSIRFMSEVRRYT